MSGSVRPHIFFSSELDSAQAWQEALAAEFDELTFSTSSQVDHPDSVDIALVWKVPKEGLEQFKNLKAILSLGAGINQLDPQRLPAGVPLARLVDQTLKRTMVEYAKAAVFRYHRNFDVFEQESRLGTWRFMPPNLAEQTSVGVLGLGELGGAIATALKQDGFDVHGWSRTRKQLPGICCHIGNDGLEAVARRSSILINVLPLTSDTGGILSRKLFDQCRGARLINMGRGSHLVETDLLEALETEHLTGATLDVTSIEPLPTKHPFWNNPHILITPHVAGLSSPATAAQVVAANIRRALAGEPLLNEVRQARGY